MAAPNRNYTPVPMGPWPLGIVDRVREQSVPDSGLRAAQNVDITTEGVPVIRAGYSAVAGSTGGHSLYGWRKFGFYVTTAGNLVRLDKSGAATTIRAVAAGRMSYAPFHDRLYYSNASSYGWIDADGVDHPWGFAEPAGPALTATTGNLGAGRYQVALTATYDGGHESGPSRVVSIEVTAGAGITVTLPNPPNAIDINVYASSTRAPDGAELFLVGTFPAGTASMRLDRGNDEGYQLQMHLRRFPRCERIAAFQGVMLGAVDSVLYISEPQAPALFDARHGWIPFEAPITAILPQSDGCYVGTAEAMHWLSGPAPAEWTHVMVDGEGVIPIWTAPDARADIFPSETLPPGGVLWITQEAAIKAGKPGGLVQDITGGRKAIARHDRAALHYWEHDGRRIVLASMFNPGANPRLTAEAPINTTFRYDSIDVILIDDGNVALVDGDGVVLAGG